MNIVECIYSKCGSHDVKEESYLTNGRLFFACSCNVKFDINSASKIKAYLLNPS